jgi:hypothetical protein
MGNNKNKCRVKHIKHNFFGGNKMSEEFDPKDLRVWIEVPTEDTMKEFVQVIKIAKNMKTGKIWMFIDRVHKQNKDLSKPLGFVQLNNAQILMLAQALASVFITAERYVPADVAINLIKGGIRILE